MTENEGSPQMSEGAITRPSAMAPRMSASVRKAGIFEPSTKPMGGWSRKTRPYSAARMVSALETSKLPGSSRLSRVTTPSSTIMA